MIDTNRRDPHLAEAHAGWLERSLADEPHGMNFMRGFLIGAAASLPVWIVVLGAIVMVQAVTR